LKDDRPAEDTPSAPPEDETEPEVTAPQRDERQELQDKYLRLAAEFENYKRRAQRDQREYVQFANEGFLKELLPIVDNLERAIQASKEQRESERLVQGVELTLKQCLETLMKFGVRPIDSVGKLFDPALHQAVARVESTNAPENTVLEEYQKGYLLHDRVLRAAMVAVAVAPAPAIREENDTHNPARQHPGDALI
jgi:molecular chaperone GrpE